MFQSINNINVVLIFILFSCSSEDSTAVKETTPKVTVKEVVIEEEVIEPEPLPVIEEVIEDKETEVPVDSTGLEEPETVLEVIIEVIEEVLEPVNESVIDSLSTPNDTTQVIN